VVGSKRQVRGKLQRKSSKFKKIWTLASAGVTVFRLFTRSSIIRLSDYGREVKMSEGLINKKAESMRTLPSTLLNLNSTKSALVSVGPKEFLTLIFCHFFRHRIRPHIVSS
jgi:hypothetical protein